jgi:hypothetical protein
MYEETELVCRKYSIVPLISPFPIENIFYIFATNSLNILLRICDGWLSEVKIWSGNLQYMSTPQ